MTTAPVAAAAHPQLLQPNPRPSSPQSRWQPAHCRRPRRGVHLRCPQGRGTRPTAAAQGPRPPPQHRAPLHTPGSPLPSAGLTPAAAPAPHGLPRAQQARDPLLPTRPARRQTPSGPGWPAVAGWNSLLLTAPSAANSPLPTRPARRRTLAGPGWPAVAGRSGAPIAGATLCCPLLRAQPVQPPIRAGRGWLAVAGRQQTPQVAPRLHSPPLRALPAPLLVSGLSRQGAAGLCQLHRAGRSTAAPAQRRSAMGQISATA